jgi:3,4-dihydroxy 2-butanone 4-phosphate synthase/GTP cyclohydrolase II
MWFMAAMIATTITRIREHVRTHGAKADLARRAGLHPNTLIGIDRDDWNPTADTLLKLEAALPSASEAA